MVNNLARILQNVSASKHQTKNIEPKKNYKFVYS